MRCLHLRVVAAVCLVGLAMGQSHAAHGQQRTDAGPAASSAPPSSAAPSSEGDTKKRDAERHFDRGVELVQEQKWDAALAEFRASRELFPTRVALKNGAICLRQLGRFAEALESYQELLSLFGSSMSPDERRATEDAVVAVRTRVGELGLSIDVPGALVIVDGRDRGSVPLSSPLLVDAGTHSVRVQKDGYLAFETQLLVAEGQRRAVDVKLRPLGRAGRLSVTEADGKKLSVMVDGVEVGQTPFTGPVPMGFHTVQLGSAGKLGSAPVRIDVEEGKAASLSLRATLLDSQVRIEPTPADARIHLDGVEVGMGIWEGGLPSGSHKIEVVHDGFYAIRKDLALLPNAPQTLRISLERDLSHAMWRSAYRPFLYAEGVAGGVWAPGLGGSADAACGRGECSERSRPLGILVGARIGYQLFPRFGFEAFGGYLRMAEGMTRTMKATADVAVQSKDYRDETSLSGGLVAGSVSYRLFDRIPVVMRLWAGVARTRASYGNRGTYAGTMTPAGGSPEEFAAALEIRESETASWIPFGGPELRIGYRVAARTYVELGVAAWVFFGPDDTRTGRTERDRQRNERTGLMPDIPAKNGGVIEPGTLQLPMETGIGTFFTLAPSASLRYEF